MPGTALCTEDTSSNTLGKKFLSSLSLQVSKEKNYLPKQNHSAYTLAMCILFEFNLISN